MRFQIVHDGKHRQKVSPESVARKYRQKASPESITRKYRQKLSPESIARNYDASFFACSHCGFGIQGRPSPGGICFPAAADAPLAVADAEVAVADAEAAEGRLERAAGRRLANFFCCVCPSAFSLLNCLRVCVVLCVVLNETTARSVHAIVNDVSDTFWRYFLAILSGNPFW